MCKGWAKHEISTFKQELDKNFTVRPTVDYDEYIDKLSDAMLNTAQNINAKRKKKFSSSNPAYSTWQKRISRLVQLSYRNPKIFFRMVKAESLLPHFPMSFPTPNVLIASLTQVNNPWDPTILDDVPSIPPMDIQLPTDEQIRSVMKVRRCKSPGIDGVPPYLWYVLPDNIFRDVCEIIRHIIMGQFIPQSFYDSKLFPLFKHGDPSLAKSWRPITITTALYRIVTKLMCAQLTEHLTPHYIQCNLVHVKVGHVQWQH